jgi:DnaJ-class molecular chaperone
MTTSAYKDLNLTEGANEMEIRAAFRRMAKDNHPDSSAKGDVAKFRKACAAYKELMRKALSARKGSKPASTPRGASSASAETLHPDSTPFVFDGRRTAGLDVYLDLALVKPEPGRTLPLVIPTTALEACPRCLGQGRTLSRVADGSSVYRPQVCPKCSGQGSISRPKSLAVSVTPEMAERGKFRLRHAGGYLPKEAKRGDLIVSLRWVDQLPSGH